MTVVASGISNPEFTYQWYVADSSSANGSALTSNTDKANGSQTATYTIPKASVTTALNGKNYYCIVTQYYGDTIKNVVSNRAELTVKAKTTFTTQPVSQSKIVGNAVTYTIAVSGESNPAFTYQWYKNTSNSNSGGTAINGETGTTYTIPANSVTTSISGSYYYCVVTQKYGISTYVLPSSVASLNVVSAVTVATHPTAVNVISTKKDVTFSVVGNGSGALSYQWYQATTATGGTPTILNGSTDIANGSQTATYTIPAANANTSLNGKYYYCVITQKYGTPTECTATATSSRALLTVVPIVTISTQPGDVTKTEGHTATFTVVPNTTAGVTYQWYTATAKSGGTTNIINGATSASYTTPAATAAMDGTYYFCKVTQTYGSPSGYSETVGPINSSRALLTVGTSLSLGTVSDIYRVAGTEAASFIAAPSGIGTFEYQWYNNGTTNSNTGGTPINGQTGATYTISASNVTTDLNGQYYYCVVTQTYGTSTNTLTTNAAKLSVTSKSTITTQPTSQTAHVHSPATFSLIADGTSSPALTYQWYQSDTNSNSDGTPISGATNNTYTIPETTHALNGKYYYCVVTQSYGNTYTIASDPVQLTVTKIPASTLVTITGTNTYNKTLTADTTGSIGDGAWTYAWWYTTDPSATSGTTAPGSTNSSSYTIGSGLAGKYIGVTVTRASGTDYTSADAVTDITDSSNGTATVKKEASSTTVTITGTNTYDQTLTASVGGTAGDTSISYQWWTATSASATSGTAIEGANASTYTIGSGLVGKYIGVTVTRAEGTDYLGSSESDITDATNNTTATVAKATATTEVTITGTVKYNQTLTANTTGSVGDGEFSYQWWYADSPSATSGTAIEGANSNTYTIGSGLAGKYIGVTVSRAEGTDYNSATSQTAITGSTVAKEVSTTTVSLSGTVKYNETLTATVEGIAGDTTLSYSWWYADSSSATSGTAAPGATNSNTYTVGGGIAGKYIGVTATRAEGTNYLGSSDTAVTNSTVARATATTTVTITGTNTWDNTLTADTTGSVGDGEFSYQWWTADSPSATSGTAISGANSSTYTVPSTYIGKYIGVTVTRAQGTNYLPTSAITDITDGTNNTTGAVAKKASSTTVTITGTVQYNETLTASVTGTEGDTTLMYSWWYADSSNATSGTAAPGATNTNTYTVGDGLAGKYIGVTATRVEGTTYYGSSDSAITGSTSAKAVSTTQVTITGTNTWGNTLTADTDGSVGDGAFSYQWWYATVPTATSGTNIAGARARTYIVESDYVGKYIGVTVSRAEGTNYLAAPDKTDITDAEHNGTAIVNKKTPTGSEVTVTITGTNTWDNTLTADVTRPGDGAITYAWWYSDNPSATSGNLISGANSSTYKVPSTYIGKYIGVSVAVAEGTTYKAGGANDITDATHNTTGAVAKKSSTTTVTITGTVQYNETLTANVGGIAGDTTLSYSWWYADSSNATSGTAAPGATNSSTYKVGSGLAGKYIGVTATRTEGTTFYGSSDNAITGSTSAKAVATTQVTITGTNTWDATLTANTAGSTGDGTLSYSWWYATSPTATSGTNISGATSSTYTISSEYIGKYIGVTVTRAEGTNYTSASAVTDITDSTNNGTGAVNKKASTTTVTITGTVKYNETLTASVGGIAGDTSLSYQWWYSTNASATSGTAIEGADVSTYKIGSGLAGKYIGVTVTRAEGATYLGSSATDITDSTNNGTATVTKAAATTNVKITGTNTWDSTLTADTTGSTGDGTWSYQWWYADSASATSGTNISGATSSTYTIASDYIGKYIGVTVKRAEGTDYAAPADKTDITDATNNTTATVNKKASTTTVTITGTVQYNETLTATPSGTAGDTSISYQWWYADSSTATSGTPISGATSSTYTVGNGLIGKYIGVTATRAEGATYLGSNATAITSSTTVQAVSTTTVTITGTNTYGQTLTASVGGIAGDTSISYSWWTADSASATSGTAIEGATASTYTVGSGLVGKYIGVTVTRTAGTNYSGSSKTDITDATNNTTATVSRANGSTSLKITGTNTWDSTLTASTSGSTGDGTFSYQWWYADSSTAISGTNISGATSSTYTISSDYIDKYIGVTVSRAQGTNYNAVAEKTDITDSTNNTTATVAKKASSTTVSITGTAKYNETLTANVEGTAGDTSISYQWWHSTSSTATSGTAISGATSSTYKVESGLAGKYIGVTVTRAEGATFYGSSDNAITGSTSAKAASSTTLKITGTNTWGNTLTADTTGSTGDGQWSYQWWTATSASATSGTNIDGATSKTYVIASDYVGKYIGVTVNRAAGTNYLAAAQKTDITDATNNTTATVNKKTLSSSDFSVKVTGTNTWDQTLTATLTQPSSGLGTITYVWWTATSSTATSGTNISGATNSTYKISSDYIGKYIGVSVAVAEGTLYKSSGANDITDATNNTTATVDKKESSTGVTITGTNTYGQTLTASVTGTAGDTTISYAWWTATSASATSGTAISGATSSTYTIGTGLIGKYIGVTVTRTEGDTFKESSKTDITDATNNTTATVAKANGSTTLKITGTNTWGNTLTADTTGSTGDGNLSYQWWYATSASATSGTDITDATASTYTIASDYIGKYIGVTVSRAQGTNYNAVAAVTDITDATNNTTATVAKKASSTTVTITGTNTWGNTLTADTTGSTGDGNLSYQWWYATSASATSGTAIDGATSSTYMIGSGLVGKYIGVTATRTEGDTFKGSSKTDITDATNNTTATVSRANGSTTLKITGTNTWGNTLTADTAGSTGDGTWSYQWWYADSSTATSGTNIDGATASTYTIASDYIGKYIGVTVSRAQGTNYNAVAAVTDITDATQNSTATVNKKTPASSEVTVTITGTNIWDNILTASVTRPGDGAITYVWWYSDSSTATSGTAISGATASTYTIASDYVGKYIGVSIAVAEGTTYMASGANDITDATNNTTATVAKKASSTTVTITGTNTWGSTLTADTTGSTGDGSWSYQWWTATSASATSGTNITDATASTYTIAKDYVGKYIGVTVTRANGTTYNGSNASAKTSSTVAKQDQTFTLPALNVPIGETVTITISGTKSSGTLTSSSSNTGVATISSLTVTGVTEGTSTITVTYAADTYYNERTQTCTATVIVKNYSVSSGNPTYHQTLATAVTACEAGGTITVEEDNTSEESVTIDKNVTIALNGKTITRNAGIITVSGGTVNITGTGNITATAVEAIDVTGGTLHVKGGTITGGTYGINVGGGILNMGDVSEPISETNPYVIGDTNGIFVSSGSWNFYNGLIYGVRGASYNEDYTGLRENSYIETMRVGTPGTEIYYHGIFLGNYREFRFKNLFERETNDIDYECDIGFCL